jgi:transketolase
MSNNPSLTSEQKNLLQTFSKACRRSIVEMVKQSQSGHPGGSLSALDILATLYALRVTATDEKVVVSNGHISPGVYSVLGHAGAFDVQDAVDNFRTFGSKFEGHITRHIPGVWYGTGPLGAGVSAAAGFAWSQRRQETLAGTATTDQKKVFAMVGDGEMQEGQVHEMALFAAKEKLDNFIVFVDWNRVQLTDSLENTCPIDPVAFFAGKDWDVVTIDGHDYDQIWDAINAPTEGRPRAVVAKTIMGHGVPGMEESGQELSSAWHGKAPKPELADTMLAAIGEMTAEEIAVMEKFRADRNWNPTPNTYPELESPIEGFNAGTPTVYDAETVTDCRSAYGNALSDMAKLNKNVIAGTADLGGSVKTSITQKNTPDQHIEYGICEQNMVSAAGGMSLDGQIPFVSTFGAFMTSRAKDQARVNDINHTNVKMVSTHCGLSVGEDGPTHQAIDDSGSMLGLLNTMPLEPADPNQCDRMIRYVASHFGNYYVRMGRAKLSTLTTESGEVFFGADYHYSYGRTDLLRTGTEVTIVANGPMVHEALKARAAFANPEQVEIVIASSIKQFDATLAESIMKTGNVITVEDHNSLSGLGSAVALFAAENGLLINQFASLAVREYQLSGKPAELYASAGVDAASIGLVLDEFLSEE